MSNKANELKKLVGGCIDPAVAINHDSFWGQFDIEEDGKKSKGFFFMTINTETARKAHALLVDALPLCTTDLGPGYCTPRK